MRCANIGIVLSLVVTFAVATAAHAAAWYVSPNGNDGWDGSTGAPFKTIAHAAEQAACDDEIRIAAGLYEENVTLNGSAGVSNITFCGCYDANWDYQPGGARTVVKAADSATNAFTLTAFNNVTFRSLDVTGGKNGICMTAMKTDFDKLFATNNTECGIWDYADHRSPPMKIVRSCFLGFNKYGYRGGNDAQYSTRFFQCHFVSNSVSGFNIGANYSSDYVYNTLFMGNAYPSGYEVNIPYGDSWYFYNVALAERESEKYIGGYTGSVKINYSMIVADPKVDGKFHPTSASKLNKSGYDMRSYTAVSVLEDVYGNAFDGEYDIGCFKTDYPYPRIGPFADVYVAVDGTDDSPSGNTPETAVRTLTAAMERLSVNGTVHCGAGDFSASQWAVNVTGAHLVGEGVGKTRLVGDKSNAALLVQANDVVISNLTVTSGKPGIDILGGDFATNAVVTHCDVSGNASYGLFREMVKQEKGDFVNARFTHLTVTNNALSGIYCVSYTPIMVDNCLIASNATYGLQLVEVPYNLVNCTIEGNGQVGIMHDSEWGSFTSFIGNCIVSGSTNGILTAWNLYSVDRGPRVNDTLFANNVTNLGLRFRAAITEPKLAVSNHLLFADSVLYGKGVGLEWFRPKPSSPARCAGADVAAEYGLSVNITNDLLGAVRPHLDRADLGCFTVTPPGFVFLVR